MATITKKELVDRIVEITQTKHVVVRRVIQSVLDEVISELAKGNRFEFRDFGVFECHTRAARTSQNPKTLRKVAVPAKRTVKFKMGRILRQKMVSGT
jgi:integration host factor subunit beta